MKKSDLKTGHIVQFKNGFYGLVLKDTNFIGNIIKDLIIPVNHLTTPEFDMINWSDDGIYPNDCNLDIIQVYQTKSTNINFSLNSVKSDFLIPLYKMELTISEIEEKLGLLPGGLIIKK